MELKDCLPYYIGCQMVRSSHWEPQNETYQLTFENIKEAIEFGDRPILRQLQDLTDEEIKEFIGWDNLNKLYMDVSFDRCVNGIIVYYTIDASEDAGTIFPMTHKITFHVFSPKEWVLLLSKEFDLFQLIKNGLAVNSKILNKTV